MKLIIDDLRFYINSERMTIRMFLHSTDQHIRHFTNVILYLRPCASFRSGTAPIGAFLTHYAPPKAT